MKTYRNVFLATLTAMAVTIPAFGAEGKGSGKVDRALAGSLKSGGKHKILITTQPGERENVKKHLGKRGGKFKAEHASLNLLVGEYTTEEILDLIKDNKVKGLSLDEPVNAQQLGSLTSLTGNLLGSDSVVAESLTSLGVDARSGHDDPAPDAGPVGRRRAGTARRAAASASRSSTRVSRPA